jgi:ligand-binding sensor protein
MNEMYLTDFIDVKALQDIQDGFTATTGIAALIVDAEGNPLTRGNSFSPFCTDIIRKSCNNSRIEKRTGIVEIDAPITISGKTIASIIGGQILSTPANEDKIRKYACDLGVSADEYLSVIRKAKIIPKHQIDSASDFLNAIAMLLSKAAYSSYVSSVSSSGKSSNLDANAIIKISEAENLISQNENTMKKLRAEFSELEAIAEKSVSKVNSTKETVKVIKDISMNTRILGFNAYIEAARAKESGKGFAVITQEIRSLADTSKESADEIEMAMKSISDFTKQIDNQIKATEQMVTECIRNISQFSYILNSLLASNKKKK